MVRVWREYRTDLGRAYPFLALYTVQINDVTSNVNPIELLPDLVTNNLFELKNSCGVEGLTLRSILLFTSDGGQFRVNYPTPFNEALFDYLTANTQVTAFEFVGERLKYGRLKKMLENV